jgi:emopamil binding protein
MATSVARRRRADPRLNALLRSPPMAEPRRRQENLLMSRRDRATIALLCFFSLVAVTLELYFLVFHRDLPARADTQVIARLFAIYGTADRAYFDPVSPLALALEGINVFVMQPLCLLLVYAILRQRAYRWPLQLAIGSYLALSVVLYFLVAIVSGYEGMPERSGKAYALFYLANLPWLVGYAWLALDAGVVIARALAAGGAVRDRARCTHEAPSDAGGGDLAPSGV